MMGNPNNRKCLLKESGWEFFQEDIMYKNKITSYFIIITPIRDDISFEIAAQYSNGEKWCLNYYGIELVLNYPELPESFIHVINSFKLMCAL